MKYQPDNPLIVQSDSTILLEVNNTKYQEARICISRFSELEKSPEHIHTYRITPLSLWNAASSGLDPNTIIDQLNAYSKYDVPQNVLRDILEFTGRYGKVRLTKADDSDVLLLHSTDPIFIEEISHNKSALPYIAGRKDDNHLEIKPEHRGMIKQVLIKMGFPVEDLAGYRQGTPHPIHLRAETSAGHPFNLRHYQEDSVACFYQAGSVRGGSGVIVLPCGAGKTIIGIAVMSQLQTQTLILCTNIVAVRQWMDEILDKTDIRPEDIGEYSGEKKEIKPITISTYQILTYRKDKQSDFAHFHLFNSQQWGLIIYDEVHLLPAPIFRITSSIQSTRRLGLTATLIREDGHESDVFSLIGPKKQDIPWKELEKEGWIATAFCHEIRVPLPDHLRMQHAMATSKTQYRIASENTAKISIVQKLLEKHKNDNVLIIGQFLTQLDEITEVIKAPLITGSTKNEERQRLYSEFKSGKIKILIVSKVANFSVDLPDANVAIQISGTFGSRQEEAQRLGRILRPKKTGEHAHFYSIITRETADQKYAAKRQLFLTEQGYSYEIIDSKSLE
ncbi:MAG: helicase [Candidatus Auribacter fodinae]|jgi:DNA excision repair protein ERCC-3|uniref:DNA 3'-5' helicase n=1 Tax=Candidatus Auribacter fodinae TaxID=2093366 RepID=A0A3A4R5U4_9BACT|nr:MAG: helicase [Candidatus Auribacter fodinae]